MGISKQDKIVRRELLGIKPKEFKYIPYEFHGRAGTLICKLEHTERYVHVCTNLSLNLLDNFSDGIDVYFDRKECTFKDDGYTFYNLHCERIEIEAAGEELISKSLSDLLTIIQRLYGKRAEY